MWESGQNRPKIDRIYKLAEIFGVKPSDIMPKLEGDEVELINIPKPVKVIPLYSLPVSAGNGMFPNEVYILDRIPIHRIDVDFAVKVDGDSMEPVVPDGAIVFVKETSKVRDGDMILCTYNKRVFIRWIHKGENDTYLISENLRYPPIRVDKDDKFIIHGVVVDVTRNSQPRRRFSI